MQKIDELITQNRLDEAIRLLGKQVDAGNADDNTYFTMGKLLWRLGRRSEAMDAYNRAVSINPDSPANVAIEQARAIFDFYNPDLLNP